MGVSETEMMKIDLVVLRALFAAVMVCSCACQAGRLAVIEGESVPVEGIYTISGDACPEGANAWLEQPDDKQDACSIL